MPIPLAALAAMGGGAASAVGGIMEAKKSFTTTDRERMNKLKRLQELGQLGLDPKQQMRMREQLLGPVEGAHRESKKMRGAIDPTAGSEIRKQFAQQDQLQRERALAMQKLAQADAMVAAQQEEELLGLSRQEDVGKLEMRAAIAGGVADVLGGAASSAQLSGEAISAMKLRQEGADVMKQQARSALSQVLGVDMTEEELTQMMKLIKGVK